MLTSDHRDSLFSPSFSFFFLIVVKWASLVAQMVKESACNAGDLGSIPGSGKSPGGGNGYQLQYFCLENSIYREAWQTTVHGVAKS